MRGLSFLLLAMALSARAQLTRTYSNCVVLDQSAEFIMHYEVSGATLRLAMEAPSAGWIALGFSHTSQNAMVGNGAGADILMGFVKPSGACTGGCLFSYHPTSYPSDTGNPAVVSPPSATLVAGSASGGRMYVEFDRPLNGTRSIIDPSAVHHVLWAYNAVDSPDDAGTTFTKHAGNTRGVYDVMFDAISPTCELTGPAVTGGDDFVSPDGKFSAKWSVEGEAITFEVSAETQGWVSLGFSDDALMTNTDVVVGWVEAGVAYVSDRTIEGSRTAPTEDATSDLTAATGFETPTHTTIRFTRPLVGTNGVNADLSAGPTHLLWAYGGSYNDATRMMGQHVPSQRGAAAGVDFTSTGCGGSGGTTVVAGPDALMIAHVVGMTLAWMALLPVGSFLARYLKAHSTAWFPGHVVLQVVGLVLTIVGLATVFVSRGGFVMSAHAVVGLITVVLAVLQGAGGGVAHCMYNPDRDGPPVFPDQIHWWLGRLLMLLSAVAMFLGVAQYGLVFSGAAVGAWVCLGVWAALTIVVWVVAEVNKRKGEGASRKEGLPFPGGLAIFALVASVVLMAALCGTLLVAGGAVSGGAPVVARGPQESISTCFTMPRYALPNNKPTYYTCMGFEFPQGDDFHMFHFEPIIENLGTVHHILMYDTGSTLLSSAPYECNMPAGSSPLWAWAIGGPEFVSPSNSGFRMPRYGALQIHYDNPTLTPGIVDSSGVLIKFTNILRDNESALFRLGVSTSAIRLPADQQVVEIVSVCTLPSFPATTQPRVWAAALHMHQYGKGIVIEHHRRNSTTGEYERLPDLHCNSLYDFNKQSFDRIPDVILRSQDRFVTRCRYSTSGSGAEIRGGDASSEEMCVGYLAYDPDLGGGGCVTEQVIEPAPRAQLCYAGNDAIA